MSTSFHALCVRMRRLGLGLLLLAVPACGLSDYEVLMVKAQKNEERFREEQKYLDGPLQIPTRKNDQGQEQKIATMFLRPPNGIDLKPQPEPEDNLMWRYPARSTGNDFRAVELAFAGDDDKDFAHKVVGHYPAAEPHIQSTRQITPAGQETPITFDTWELSNSQGGYSINITQGRSKPIAIVYNYNKTRLDLVRKVIELSLQSLALDQQFTAAQLRYNQKSPWRLKSTLTP